ncbi:hypothetical protein AAG570_001260 [Ranatra chinensis]|uniref:Hcy-binding domain-containing protein n=1 Tax=Ranatra chinensis TaxID=642074 RepID=A0ABD0YBD1_9HEMI
MGKVLLLDGGFSTQLAKHVGAIIDGDPLWSARFIATDKEKCILVHRDYVRAGSNIITTGSYQASISGYKTHLGLEKEEAIQVIKDSVALARKGIELECPSEQESKVLVAGSVGPYGATLHDGSEYTGKYSNNLTLAELIEWHRPRVEALIDAGVDLLAFETIPCSNEAFALITLLLEFPKIRAWLSFSIKEKDKISNGDSFVDTAAKCWKMGSTQLVAIGVNCLHPSLVTPILTKLKSFAPQVPLIVYPNSGERFDQTENKWTNKENWNSVSDYVEEWLDIGVSYLGGCCRTNDNDIKKFSEILNVWETKKGQET